MNRKRVIYEFHEFCSDQMHVEPKKEADNGLLTQISRITPDRRKDLPGISYPNPRNPCSKSVVSFA